MDRIPDILQNPQSLEFNKIYRGIVVYNEDPKVKGRCKVWVIGVYPESFRYNPDLLPWAEPVMPLFGGNWTNENGGLNSEVGVSTIPHASKAPGFGSEVWLFFENGNHNYPKFFGACQGGVGWLSEHSNQHVIKTDNVRIRVDENPELDASTCKFDSYNTNCTDTSTMISKTQMPTRVDVEIWNSGNSALNLIIKGHVNIHVEGNVYEEIIGEKHETHIGNLFRHHVGDIHHVHEGNEVHERTGDYTEKHTGNKIITQSGNKSEFVFGYINETSETKNETVQNMYSTTVNAVRKQEILGLDIKNVNGEVQETVNGMKKTMTMSNINIAFGNIETISASGNILTQTFKDDGMIVGKAVNISNIAQLSIIDCVDYTNAGGTINHNNTAFVLTDRIY